MQRKGHGNQLIRWEFLTSPSTPTVVILQSEWNLFQAELSYDELRLVRSKTMAQGFILCDLGSANVDNASQCVDGLDLPALDEPQLLQQGPGLASLQAREITEVSLSSNGFDLPALDGPQPPGCSHARNPSLGPEDLFSANNLVESSIATLGHHRVASKLKENLFVHTLFSGAGGGEAAAECLAAAACQRFGAEHLQVRFGISADISTTSKRFLGSAFPNRCLFGDVNAWRCSQSMWPTAHCFEHCKQCQLIPEADAGETKVLIFGGPCVAHTKMGDRREFQDQRTRCHFVALDHAADAKYDLILAENVTEYPMETFLSSLGSQYSVKTIQMDPRLMGWPAGRERVFGAAVRKSWGMWSENDPWSTLKAIVSRAAPGTCECFYRSSLAAPPVLSSAMQARLEAYEAKYGSSSSRSLVWDITQNPAKRPRTNRQDGSLPTLMRRSRLYAPNLGVVLNGMDSLAAMGFPVSSAMAAATGVSRWRSALQALPWSHRP